MPRIENTSGRRYDINFGGILVASIPRAQVDEVSGAKVNGAGEIADDLLDKLLAEDAWTKGVFESGDLVRVAASEVAPAQSAGDPAAQPAESSDTPVPALADTKGKPKK